MGSADAPQTPRSKEKAPRGETGLFLRREQLGEARCANADEAETFRANQGSGRVSQWATASEQGQFLKKRDLKSVDRFEQSRSATAIDLPLEPFRNTKVVKVMDVGRVSGFLRQQMVDVCDGSLLAFLTTGRHRASLLHSRDRVGHEVVICIGHPCANATSRRMFQPGGIGQNGLLFAWNSRPLRAFARHRHLASISQLVSSLSSRRKSNDGRSGAFVSMRTMSRDHPLF